MALNQNHTENGNVLINNAEITLKKYKNIELVFSDVTCRTNLLKGIKKGNVYLTPYRLVFVSSNARDCLASAMFPYCHLTCCSIEQPVFAANYINGTVAAEPSGGWEGKARFKMAFPRGGALEFGQHLLKLAANAYGASPNQIDIGSHGYPSPRPMNSSLGFTDETTAQQPNLYPMADSVGQAYLPLPAVTHAPAPHTMTPPPAYAGFALNMDSSPHNLIGPHFSNNLLEGESVDIAYYNPNSPYNVYMPKEPPPCYTRYPESSSKKQLMEEG